MLGHIICVLDEFRVFGATLVVACLFCVVTLFVLLHVFGSIFLVLVLRLDLFLLMHGLLLFSDVASASLFVTPHTLFIMCRPIGEGFTSRFIFLFACCSFGVLMLVCCSFSLTLPVPFAAFFLY